MMAFRGGRTVVAPDIAANANLNPAERTAFAEIQIGSYVGLPLVQEGRFVTVLGVQTNAPRAWMTPT